MRGPILHTELENVTSGLQSSTEYQVNPRFTCHKPPEIGLWWALAKAVLANLLRNPVFPPCAAFLIGLVFLKEQILSWHNTDSSHWSQWSWRLGASDPKTIPLSGDMFVATRQDDRLSAGDGRLADRLLAQIFSICLSHGVYYKERQKQEDETLQWSWHEEEETSLAQAELEEKNFYQGSAKYKSPTDTAWLRQFWKKTVAN